MMVPTTISEDKSSDLEYGEGRPGGPSKKASIRVSALPKQIRESASKLDRDGDGALSNHDVAMALHHLDSKERENRNLRNMLIGFCVLTVLLVACIFGASVAAARLSQEVSVSADNGFAYVKGTHEVMKTEDAVIWENGNIANLDSEAINKLTEIVLADGDVRFKIMGNARDSVSNKVVLLVEGGTLTWDDDGLSDATGTALALLEVALGADFVGTADAGEEGGKRQLLGACGDGDYSYGPY